jgi:hypothetical protein
MWISQENDGELSNFVNRRRIHWDLGFPNYHPEAWAELDADQVSDLAELLDVTPEVLAAKDPSQLGEIVRRLENPHWGK